jgi:DNA (cytosine-5)-methyltransferase 1
MTGGKWDKMHESAKRIYSADGISPTIHTVGGGNLEPKIMTEPLLVGGYGEKKSNGGTQWYQQDRVYSADSVAMAHCASIPQGSYSYYTGNKKSPIRKLTQKECWRLMDFSDNDYENARKALNDTYYNGKDKSGSQLYKQAGNSIVVAALEAIFKEMLLGE